MPRFYPKTLKTLKTLSGFRFSVIGFRRGQARPVKIPYGPRYGRIFYVNRLSLCRPTCPTRRLVLLSVTCARDLVTPSCHAIVRSTTAEARRAKAEAPFHLSSFIIRRVAPKKRRKPPPEMSRTPTAAPRRYFWLKGCRFKGSKARTVAPDSITACSAFAPVALRRDKPAGQTFLCLETTVRVLCLSRHSAKHDGGNPVTLEPLNLAVRRDSRTSTCRRRS